MGSQAVDTLMQVMDEGHPFFFKKILQACKQSNIQKVAVATALELVILHISGQSR